MFDGNMLEQLEMSKSKARRRRNKTLLKRLWNASHDVKGQPHSEPYMVGPQTFEAINWKLSCLESLMFDLHWAFVGQWHFDSMVTCKASEYTRVETPDPPISQLPGVLCPREVDSEVSEQLLAQAAINSDLTAFLSEHDHAPLAEPSPLEDRLSSDDGTHSENSEVCARCCMLFGEVTENGSWDGDACEWCCSPHHTECLVQICNLKGSWDVCATCASDSERVGIRCDLRRLPEAAWDSIYARFVPDASESGLEPISRGWPDLSEDQQTSFQQWYASYVQSRKEILMKAVEQLQQQAEEAEARNEIGVARANVDRTRQLMVSLKELGTLEDMRLASWRFNESRYAANV